MSVSYLQTAGPSLRAAADAYLDTIARPTTARAYAFALDRLVKDLGPERMLAAVTDIEVGAVLETAWGSASVATWNTRRAAIASWLTWCARQGYSAPSIPESARYEPSPSTSTPVRSRAAIERLIRRSDIALREKLLWRMLYETAGRASEILGLNVEDLNFANRSATVVGKGARPLRRGGSARADVERELIVWESGTALLLPRYLGGRTSGPVFLTERRAAPGHHHGPRDVTEDGYARLSYDRAATLLDAATRTPTEPGWNFHELRHSALTHLGEASVPSSILMAKSRHRSLKSLQTYVRPGPAAIAEATTHLAPR